MSLISTLIVVVTIGVMGFIVVTALPGGDGDSEKRKQTKQLLDEINAPTPAGQAAQGAAAQENLANQPSAGNQRSLPSSTRVAACKANVGTVEAAARTKQATDGTFPASIDELVAGKWIDAAPSVAGYELTLESVDGQPSGRVLVNGVVGLQGCDAPPQGSK